MGGCQSKDETKYSTLSLALQSSNGISVLPDKAKAVLQESLDKGIWNGYLFLTTQGITDNMVPELCQWIAKLGSKIKELNLNNNMIMSRGATLLFHILKEKKLYLTGLYLSNNQIDDDCMHALGEYIHHNHIIQNVNIGQNKISSKGIKDLAPHLTAHPALKNLIIQLNPNINDDCVPSLIKMIETSRIEDINIGRTSISQQNAIAVLLACNKIKNGADAIDLSYKGVTDADLVKLSDYLKHYGCKKFKDISIVDNHITSKGANYLFDILKDGKSIIATINLEKSEIGDDCIRSLGELIHSTRTIKKLNLSNSKVSDKGIEVLSDYISGSVTLNEVSLTGNDKITEKSANCLIEAVKRSSITKMSLYGTQIPEERHAEISSLCSVPIDQREIPVTSNTKSATKTS